jgi:hypothetical protein
MVLQFEYRRPSSEDAGIKQRDESLMGTGVREPAATHCCRRSLLLARLRLLTLFRRAQTRYHPHHNP